MGKRTSGKTQALRGDPPHGSAGQNRKRPSRTPPPFTIRQILAWADAYHRRTGKWPGQTSGPVAESPRENWHRIEHALRRGYRGLPGGSSLAMLLAERAAPATDARCPRFRRHKSCNGPTHITITPVDGPTPLPVRWMADPWPNLGGDQHGPSHRRSWPAGRDVSRHTAGETTARAARASPHRPHRYFDPGLGRRASPANREMAHESVRTGARDSGAYLVRNRSGPVAGHARSCGRVVAAPVVRRAPRRSKSTVARP